MSNQIPPTQHDTRTPSICVSEAGLFSPLGFKVGIDVTTGLLFFPVDENGKWRQKVDLWSILSRCASSLLIHYMCTEQLEDALQVAYRVLECAWEQEAEGSADHFPSFAGEQAIGRTPVCQLPGFLRRSFLLFDDAPCLIRSRSQVPFLTHFFGGGFP